MRLASWEGDDYVREPSHAEISSCKGCPLRRVMSDVNVHLDLVVDELDHAYGWPVARLAKRHSLRRKHVLHLLE
jgi:hypothetical protein